MSSYDVKIYAFGNVPVTLTVVAESLEDWDIEGATIAGETAELDGLFVYDKAKEDFKGLLGGYTDRIIDSLRDQGVPDAPSDAEENGTLNHAQQGMRV